MNDKRKKLVLTQMTLIGVTIFAILLLVENIMLERKYKMPKTPDGYDLLYYEHYIYPEDTISEIALETVTDNEMPVTVQQEIDGILELNNMGDEDRLTAGEYILVPYWVKKEEQ